LRERRLQCEERRGGAGVCLENNGDRRLSLACFFLQRRQRIRQQRVEHACIAFAAGRPGFALNDDERGDPRSVPAFAGHRAHPLRRDHQVFPCD